MVNFFLTGLPKPANINLSKSIGYSKFLQFSELEPEDRVYTTTPLYHSAATLALFSIIDTGQYCYTHHSTLQYFNYTANVTIVLSSWYAGNKVKGHCQDGWVLFTYTQ